MTARELKKMRKELGLTQGELAARAHVKRSMIASIESLKNKCSQDTEGKILEVFNAVKRERFHSYGNMIARCECHECTQARYAERPGTLLHEIVEQRKRFDSTPQ